MKARDVKLTADVAAVRESDGARALPDTVTAASTMKIFIDTNWYLSHYQSATEKHALFDRILPLGPRIVMTQQSVSEFERNRETLLRTLRAKVVQSTTIQPWTVSLLQSSVEYRSMLSAKAAFESTAEALTALLDGYLDYPGRDPVYKSFQKLKSACTVLETSEALVMRAWMRKLRGDPPSSSKRDTIGDEITWEALLEHVEEDLAIVTQDSDFLAHARMLRREFQRRNVEGDLPPRRFLIHIGKTLGGLLAAYGEQWDELDKVESDMDPSLRCRQCSNFAWEETEETIEEEEWTYAVYKCAHCGHKIQVA